MIKVNDLNKLDGIEIRPGVYLIGTPGYHKESGKWRCLANVGGALCLVELNIAVISEDDQ
jgi:hypothetical protein